MKSKMIVAILVVALSMVVFAGCVEKTHPTMQVGFQSDEIVDFPDPELEQVMLMLIEKTSGHIYKSELEQLPLIIVTPEVTDISGIEYCTEAYELYFMSNQVIDYSPLTELKNITLLNITRSDIQDFSHLMLPTVRRLFCKRSGIVDLSPIYGSRIEKLDCDRNQVSDLTPLTNVTTLNTLHLADNQIRDISPLANLTNLRVLYLHDNDISDISPLVENTGLGQGDYVALGSNPLSDLSLNVYIPQLEERGVQVSMVSLIEPTPIPISDTP